MLHGFGEGLLPGHVLGSGVDQAAGGGEVTNPAPTHETETARAIWSLKENWNSLGRPDVVGGLPVGEAISERRRPAGGGDGDRLGVGEATAHSRWL